MTWLRKTWPYIVLVLLLATNIAVWLQRDHITDWWQLRNYTPASNVASLATDSTMTPYATKLFYVNHPSLETKEAFNKHCSETTEETAVLGCYHGNRQGIYIYAVQDKRLAGVRQVTAAHEMLHQAYDRLGSGERERVNSLLLDFYNSSLTDEAIKNKIDSYKKHEGAILVNEMHSIFGSEVRQLSSELEMYYAQYFSDRGKLVGFSEQYQGEFNRRKELVAQYDAQLADLKRQIATNKISLETKMRLLKAKEAEIEQDITARDQSAYATDVQEYNATVGTYNEQLVATRKLIDQHNNIVTLRNDIAVQEQELQQALDSRLDSPSAKQ